MTKKENALPSFAAGGNFRQVMARADWWQMRESKSNCTRAVHLPSGGLWTQLALASPDGALGMSWSPALDASSYRRRKVSTGRDRLMWLDREIRSGTRCKPGEFLDHPTSVLG
jgi:hypothetical protein